MASSNYKTTLKLSLKNNISNEEGEAAKNLSLGQCQVIAAKATEIRKNLKFPFYNSKNPGEVLIDELHKGGYLAEDYRKWLEIAQNAKTVKTYYEPQTKVAVLIANDKYKLLPKLASPSQDCDDLKIYLKIMGFIVFTIRNSSSEDLKLTLEKVFEAVPEKSYCIVFYAGHGFEICNTRCTLDITSPVENITMDHCVTENFILQAVAKCEPELCVLFMDMCRLPMERDIHPKLYETITSEKTFYIDAISSLLISHSAAPNQKAYEMCQIFVSGSCDTDSICQDSVILNSGDSKKIISSVSQYVQALCTRLQDDLDISTLIDKVHEDVEGKSLRRQRPMKIQCGVAKRSLYDLIKGDTKSLFKKLKEYCDTTNTRLKEKAEELGEKYDIDVFYVSRPKLNANYPNVVFLTPDVARVIKEC